MTYLGTLDDEEDSAAFVKKKKWATTNKKSLSRANSYTQAHPSAGN